MGMPRSAVFVAALMLAGCGSNDEANSADEVGDIVKYGSFGTRATIDCGQGKSLDIGGSNNTLKVTGRCASVTIEGADNTISVARIDGELSVVGLNNTVTYEGGDPNVNDSGSGNRISRGRPGSP